MKKSILVILISFLLVVGAAAQGLYLDAGIGLGKATSTWADVDLLDVFTVENDIGIELGAKVGFAPIRKVPLYIVLDVDGVGHRLNFKDSSYFQFNTVLIGPGVIFYPVDILQIGGSFGISNAYVVDDDNDVFDAYKRGTAWNIYAALDLGGKGSGTLLGVKLQTSTNEIDLLDFFGADFFEDGVVSAVVEQKISLFSVFVRFAIR